MKEQKSIVTVGTFDGVHRGHLEVIGMLLERANALQLDPVLITFTSHPLATIAPERATGLLMTLDEKMRALREAGIEPVAIDFDKHLQGLTAREWMLRMREEYGAQAIITGYDNTFGCDGRHMTHADYRRTGSELGLEVLEAPQIEGVSSSTLRRLVTAGDVREASHRAGRRYSLSGIVGHGQELGRTIGFPTANVEPDSGKIIPANGVYAAVVSGENVGSNRPAVVNIGTRPTVDAAGERSIECHIPGFSGDLYGKRLTVEFTDRLRDERRFTSLDELKAAIAADITALKPEV